MCTICVFSTCMIVHYMIIFLRADTCNYMYSVYTVGCEIHRLRHCMCRFCSIHTLPSTAFEAWHYPAQLLKLLLFSWPLVYNRAKPQWHTQRRKLRFFSIDNRLKITIGTIIHAIQNMSSLNVECRMVAGCNSVIDWRS